MTRRAQAIDERAPLDHEGDPYHDLRAFITVNGARMHATFASMRERAECLPVLLRPWNADGVLHPLITKLHEYHPAKHTIEVLGYPVTVEFESAEDAAAGLLAYLGEPEPAPAPRARARRSTPPANAPASTSPAADAGSSGAPGGADDAQRDGEGEGDSEGGDADSDAGQGADTRGEAARDA